MTAFLPGPIRQTGFVVTDLDAALTTWVEGLGVGPWLVRGDASIEQIGRAHV